MSWLSGCATAGSDYAACPHVVRYSERMLDKAADELTLLPYGSAIESMLMDYAVMREQSRICRGVSK